MKTKYIDKIEFEDCVFNSDINLDPGYLQASICVESVILKVHMKNGNKYSSRIEWCDSLTVDQTIFPMLSDKITDEINDILNQNGDETLVMQCLKLFEGKVSKIRVNGSIDIEKI